MVPPATAPRSGCRTRPSRSGHRRWGPSSAITPPWRTTSCDRLRVAGTLGGWHLRCQPPSGSQDHFDAVIFLIPERLIGIGRVVEAQAVGDDVRGVDLAALDAVH